MSGAGSKLSVAGVLNPTAVDGLATYTISASNGGAVQAGGLTLATAATVNVDATSSIEIGTANAAQAGTFSVDAGAIASFSVWGDINAPTISNAGTITSSVTNATNASSLNATTITNSGSITDVYLNATTINNTGAITLIGESITGSVINNGVNSRGFQLYLCFRHPRRGLG